MAINWQHEAHPTTGERLSEKVLDPDHRACQDRGMRAKIGQIIRGALEGALNQTTANDTGRAGGAGPPGSGGGWAESKDWLGRGACTGSHKPAQNFQDIIWLRSRDRALQSCAPPSLYPGIHHAGAELEPAKGDSDVKR